MWQIKNTERISVDCWISDLTFEVHTVFFVYDNVLPTIPNSCLLCIIIWWDFVLCLSAKQHEILYRDYNEGLFTDAVTIYWCILIFASKNV